MSEKKPLSVRVNNKDWEKFKYIAGKKNLRPHAFLIRTIETHIDLFEKVHGNIDTPNTK